MKREKYSEERFHNILWDLYQNTTNGKTIMRYSKFCREHVITNNLFPVLLENKILKKEKVKLNALGKHTYAFTWISIQPNIHMAKKLMQELVKKQKQDNDKHKKSVKVKTEKLLNNPEMEINKEPKQKFIPVYDLTENSIASDDVNINPVYEMKQATIDSEDLNKYDIKIPVSETPFISNPVTLSSDNPYNASKHLSENQKPKNQKSISIAWGLISIKW